MAQTYPNHPAVIEAGRILSYQWLSSAIQGFATRFVLSDIGPGTCVALVLPNGVRFVSAFFAVAHLGGIVVPLNPALQESELAAAMADARVSVVLTVGALRDRCAQALYSAVGRREDAVILLEELDNLDNTSAPKLSQTSWPLERAAPHASVLSLSSSGSTGQPKRIVRSHLNLLYETDYLIKALQFSPSDRILGVAAFSHTKGLIRCMVAALLSGATLIPLAQFERRAVGRIIQEHGVTVFIGVPFMFAMLAETRWPRPVDFSSLRLCISSSAPLRPDIGRHFYERYGIYVRQAYGSTETGSIAVNLSPHPEEAMESVGSPPAGISVEIFSDDRRILPPGEVGEIGIKSPAAAREYANAPDQTATAFVNGYFFPGDIGRKDSGGRLYVLGRKSLFINRSGYKVNPYELEELIDGHPKVREVAVVGVDAAYGDQKIKAVIVPTEPCEEREIIEFCRGKIADFKIPSIVEFRTALPKSATGKILRTML
jgi:long-chain acyl-CoA synthetase